MSGFHNVGPFLRNVATLGETGTTRDIIDLLDKSRA
jgi:hypothetical protein